MIAARNGICSKCGEDGLWLASEQVLVCDGCRFVEPRAMTASKALGVLVLVVVALAFLCSTAHADVPMMGATPDAGVATPVAVQLGVPLPDGGTEDVPAPIHAGQVAPVDGVLLTTAEAAKRSAERTELRTEVADLKDALASSPAAAVPMPAWIGLAVTIAAGAYCGGHDCNPFHIGRK